MAANCYSAQPFSPQRVVMAQIIVERSHNLGREAAREKADELAAR